MQWERAAPRPVPRGGAGAARLPPRAHCSRQLLRWVWGPWGPPAGGEHCPSPRHSQAVAGVAEPLRLHGGESRCDGRLEVAVRPGVWARVSVGLWDNGTATVVCRQLGCGVPEKIHAAPANGSGPIELQELRCVGTEELLAQCNATRMAAEPSKNPEELAIACSGECTG